MDIVVLSARDSVGRYGALYNDNNSAHDLAAWGSTQESDVIFCTTKTLMEAKTRETMTIWGAKRRSIVSSLYQQSPGQPFFGRQIEARQPTAVRNRQRTGHLPTYRVVQLVNLGPRTDICGIR